MATKNICHSARVIWVEGSRVGLSFESRTGCSGCQAKHKCGMSGASDAESTKHEIEVVDHAGVGYKVGDDVTLSITMEMGALAVVLAYVVPLLVMLAMMIVSGLLGLKDIWVALAGIAGVTFYYIFLYFYRGKLKKSVNFTINK